MYIIKLFLIVCICNFSINYIFSDLKLDSFSFQNYYPQEVHLNDIQHHSYLKLNKSESHSYQIPNLVIKQISDVDESQISALITKNTPALAYPNPFKLSSGVEIGFYSSETFDAQLLVYDMLGHLRIKKDILVSNSTYNVIALKITDFYGGSISSGAYFYVIVRGSEIVRKGKMGIIP